MLEKGPYTLRVGDRAHYKDDCWEIVSISGGTVKLFRDSGYGLSAECDIEHIVVCDHPSRPDPITPEDLLVN